MYTVELTADELRMTRSALRSYLHDFGHDEKDVLRAVRALVTKIDKIQAAGDTGAESA